jgi:hypothetical protein
MILFSVNKVVRWKGWVFDSEGKHFMGAPEVGRLSRAIKS